MICTEYRVTRHYGGPEEGGWWYDWYEAVRIHCTGDPDTTPTPERIKDPEFPHQGRFSVGSYNGDTVFLWEDTFGENASTERPYYE